MGYRLFRLPQISSSFLIGFVRLGLWDWEIVCVCGLVRLWVCGFVCVVRLGLWVCVCLCVCLCLRAVCFGVVV